MPIDQVLPVTPLTPRDDDQVQLNNSLASNPEDSTATEGTPELGTTQVPGLESDIMKEMDIIIGSAESYSGNITNKTAEQPTDSQMLDQITNAMWDKFHNHKE